MSHFSLSRLFGAVFLLCLLPACVSEPLPVPRSLSDEGWQHASWTGRDGAPTGIMAMEQTADGVLWLGSRQGLYRFDGLRFTRVGVVDESAWSPADIYALKAMPNGDLWIGQFVGGAIRLRNGQVTRYRDGLPKAGVTQFLEDKAGDLWASTTAGLAKFDGNSFHAIGPETGIPAGMSVTAIVDGRGNLLVRTYAPGLFVLRPGEKRFVRIDDGLSGYMPFALDKNGIAWESSKDTLYRINPDSLKPEEVTQLSYEAFAPDIRVDPAGGFWFTERGFGVRHVLPLSPEAGIKKPSRLLSFLERDGLTSNQAMSNFVDRDGDLWVGTERGLDRFHAGAVTRIDEAIGSAYIGVKPASDGRLWMIAFMGGAWVRSADGTLSPQSRLPKDAKKITSLASDGNGGVWTASSLGIGKLTQDRWELLPLAADMGGKSVTALVNSGGRLCAAVDRLGVECWDGNSWQLVQGTPGISITALASSSDFLYVGTRDGWLLRADLHAALPQVKAQEIAHPSLGSITVLTATGQDVWLGGDKGVGVWNGSGFHSLPLQSNPAIYRVSGLVITKDGDLWMNTPVGIAHATASMVRETLSGRIPIAQLQIYDAADGVEGTPLRSFLMPTAISLSSGKLVFTTQLGVYEIDPSHLAPRQDSAAPTIRALRADGENVSLSKTALRSRIHTLDIEYGSASLRDAQRLTYRYRLHGYDSDWQMAGNRTAALYTDVPPGEYSFLSQSSYDGVHWSASSHPLVFRVPPAFLQRASVRLTGVLLLVAAMWVYLRRRFTRIYELAQMRLQERLQERERIARDLHDTLLQGVQGLILRFGAIAESAPYNDAQRDNMQQALMLAESVVTEGRDRVRDLRKQSDDVSRLEECLVEAGTILSLSSKSRFQWETQGRKVILHPLITDELFMIGREALQNAFQHAEAANIMLRLVYTNRDLAMTIKDDGKGMPHGEQAAGKEGHWGLAGMRERTARIGGRITLGNAAGGGCAVTVVVAAAVAYRDHVSAFDDSWFDRMRAILQRKWRHG